MSKPRILIIDDEPQIRRLLQIALGNNDFEVEEAATAKEGIALAASLQPEVILLDIGLPDVSGHEVLKELRSWYERPVIILSALDTETDIVHALDSGANDYLVKPFRTGELMARIRTALRSTNGTGTESQFMVDDIVLDISAHTVSCSGEQVKLTATEFNLLALFMRNEGKALTHQFILKNVWGPTHIYETQYLRVFIAQLRKKIEQDPNNPKHIITESGVGYRFI